MPRGPVARPDGGGTMRRVRWTTSVIAAVVLSVIAAGCYPPSQTATPQSLPPGGRVVATGPLLTQMWIADATDDLSAILYAREPFEADISKRTIYRYFVYDDATGTTTE